MVHGASGEWKLNVFHFPISAYGTSDAHMWSAIHCLEYDRWIKILELVGLGDQLVQIFRRSSILLIYLFIFWQCHVAYGILITDQD